MNVSLFPNTHAHTCVCIYMSATICCVHFDSLLLDKLIDTLHRLQMVETQCVLLETEKREILLTLGLVGKDCNLPEDIR